MRFFAAATLTASLVIATCIASPQLAGDALKDQTPPATAANATRFPSLILWAWEQPENLSFIDPRRVGVAYLVRTIRLSGDAVLVQPNLNGLRIPNGTCLIACARIETDSGHPQTLSPSQIHNTASALASLAQFPNAQAVQIDFDATTSERNFYRRVLLELRRRLPASVPLSITALTSWCTGDDWISALPVNEAIPMLFRMGPDRNPILLRLESGADFEEPICRRSAGISTDEIWPRLPAGRRLYVFNPKGWTPEAVEKIMKIRK